MKRCFSCYKIYRDEYRVCPHCGQAEVTEPKELNQLRPGTILGDRYELGEAIRAGGFGIIYKAWDNVLDRTVAVKEFFPSMLVTRAPGEKNVIPVEKFYEDYMRQKERFLAEARNMARFTSNRNIPNVVEVIEANRTAYIVMELLNGMALDEYMYEHQGKVDISFALHIVNEVGNALQSLHKAGIIHQDVAPDNIFICSKEEDQIKLIDLGAARLPDDTNEKRDMVRKQGYSPVEQYINGDTGPWTDVYALGATLYVMLTGKKPDESTNRKSEDKVLAPHKLNPDIPENLSNAIMRAMAIDIPMRYKSISDFLKAINGDEQVQSLDKIINKLKIKKTLSIAAGAAAIIVAFVLALVIYREKSVEETLRPADISVWYCARRESAEKEAMEYMIREFQTTFPKVRVDLRAFSPEDYEQALKEAAIAGELPNLFESTGVPKEILQEARDVTEVLKSEQFQEALFLNQYTDYYGSLRKQIPLGIEIPIACVITSGTTSIDYTSDFFQSVSEFGEVTISLDPSHAEMIQQNFRLTGYADREDFFDKSENTSPVLLSSTMVINEVREKLQNYEKEFVFYDADRIVCAYTYEWSLGNGSRSEERAADKLLSWMLGNVYQNILMISRNSEGQIPVNPTSFETKLESKNLAPVKKIHKKFVFTGAEIEDE